MSVPVVPGASDETSDTQRVRAGDALQAIGRDLGLTAADFAFMESLRQQMHTSQPPHPETPPPSPTAA